MKRALRVLGVISAVVALDQWTKAIAREKLSYRFYHYFGDTIRLQRLENPGAFLSLGAGVGQERRFWIFTVAVGFLLLVTLWVLLRRSDMKKSTSLALSLIVGGGVGNLIDRAAKGTVTDFLNVGIRWLRTGVFNIGDVAIMLGLAMLVIAPLRQAPLDGETKEGLN